MIGLIFGIYTLYHSPSKVLLLSYLLAVVFMAGYYLWRADHVRLMPKFKVEDVYIQPARNETGRSVWVQLGPKCLTEAPVEECSGRLLCILHKWPANSGIGNGEWEETSINEVQELGWSLEEGTAITLYPGAEKRLNVFWLYSELPSKTTPQPCVNGVPHSAWEVLTQQGSFRFEVQLTAKDCKAQRVAVEYEPGENWDKPKINIVPKPSILPRHGKN